MVNHFELHFSYYIADHLHVDIHVCRPLGVYVSQSIHGS